MYVTFDCKFDLEYALKKSIEEIIIKTNLKNVHDKFKSMNGILLMLLAKLVNRALINHPIGKKRFSEVLLWNLNSKAIWFKNGSLEN
jgi:hypothetical protein